MPGVRSGVLGSAGHIIGGRKKFVGRGGFSLYGVRFAERGKRDYYETRKRRKDRRAFRFLRGGNEMNHTKFIQDSTKAYMIAYNVAMQDTHNPNMAAQIASVVVMSYMTAFKQEIEQEQQAQTMLGIMLSMVENMKGEDEDGDGE